MSDLVGKPEERFCNDAALIIMIIIIIMIISIFKDGKKFSINVSLPFGPPMTTNIIIRIFFYYA